MYSKLTKKVVEEKNTKFINFAIGFVNYNSADLLKFQFKQLAPLVRKYKFKIFIVDNSKISEINNIKNDICELSLEDCVCLIDNSQTRKTGSWAHAEGLNLILKKTKDVEYILFQDPDFFWLIKDHILFLNSIIKKRELDAIGAPYKRKVINGKPDFPCAFGCVYKQSILSKVDFSLPTQTKLNKLQAKYDCALRDLSFDVGYKIRKKYKNKNYLSFSQSPAIGLRNMIGKFSYENNPMIYKCENKIIALHLFRASQPIRKNLFNMDTRVLYAKVCFACSKYQFLKKLIFLMSELIHILRDKTDFSASYLGVQNIFFTSSYIKKKVYYYRDHFYSCQIQELEDLKFKIYLDLNLYFNLFIKYFSLPKKNDLKVITYKRSQFKKILNKNFSHSYFNSYVEFFYSLNICTIKDFENQFLKITRKKPSDKLFDLKFFQNELKIDILYRLLNFKKIV